MLKQYMPSNGDRPDNAKVEEFFITTGFYDLLPLALELAGDLGYDQTEMIEAICKVNDKFTSIRQQETELLGLGKFLRRN